jgi:hypothetical protein
MHYPGHRFALSLFAGVLAAWFAGMLLVMRQAALPAEAQGIMLVVFEPGIASDAAFAAIARAGARPIRETAFGFIWVVSGNAGRLEAEGALGAYHELPISPTIAGCVAVADAKVAQAFGL